MANLYHLNTDNPILAIAPPIPHNFSSSLGNNLYTIVGQWEKARGFQLKMVDSLNQDFL
jgi:hypothetical protein